MSPALEELTHLRSGDTGGLGELTLYHPPGTFPPSPASRVTVRAVGESQAELEGHGLDWGCGVGLLAIAASRAPRVRLVTGVDLDSANVAAARVNAVRNGASACTAFFVADSMDPESDGGKAHLHALRGVMSFLVANPPHSETGDGFDFRRRVLADVRPYLRPGALVLLQAMSVYGVARVEGLAREPGGYTYEGIALTTEVVRPDFTRPSIQAQHRVYQRAEARGARPYEYLADPSGAEVVSALDAEALIAGGSPVYVRWQVHRLRRTG